MLNLPRHSKPYHLDGPTNFMVMLFLSLQTALSMGQTMPTTGPSAVIPGTDLSVSDVCEGIIGRAQRLGNRTSAFRETWYGAANMADKGAIDTSRPILERSYQFYRATNGFRYDRRAMGSNSSPSEKVEIEAWDGKESTSLVEDPQAKPDRRFSGVVAADRNAAPTTVYWRTFVEDTVLTLDLPIDELITRTKWKPLGTKMIGTYRAVGLATIDGIQGLPDFDIQLWVAPEHDFAPVYLMVRSRTGKDVTFAAELKEVKLERRVGVAVLVAGKIETYSFPVDPEGAKVVFVYTLDQFQSSVPEHIRDFKLKFPVGTGVWDDIAKMSFIAGKVAMIRSADGTHYYVPLQAFPEYVKRTDYSKGLNEEEWTQAAKARQIDINLLEHPPTPQELDSRLNATSPELAVSPREAIPMDPSPPEKPQQFRWALLLALGAIALLGGLIIWRFRLRSAQRIK